MENSASLNPSVKLSNIIILEVNNENNSYEQISIDEFLEILQHHNENDSISKNIINYDSFEINTFLSEVYKDGKKIDLSPGEYKLLRLFIDNKGKILTTEQIINCVWGIAYANAGMLRVAINRLRSKIDPENNYIKTIRGKGYLLRRI